MKNNFTKSWLSFHPALGVKNWRIKKNLKISVNGGKVMNLTNVSGLDGKQITATKVLESVSAESVL